MFLLRGAVVSLAVFSLVYALLFAIVFCVWRKLGRKKSPRRASTLYGLRVLPLLGAGGMVALFTVPSFLYLEPHSIDERIGAVALALAGAGVMVMLIGFLNSSAAWASTARLMNASLARARRLGATHGIRAYEVLDENLALFVAGVWRPKLLVSSGAMALLDAGEIHAAMQHELAHVKRGDNLKKLVLRFCPLPGLGSLEREWLNATEEEADAAAARDERTALDLASALIKMTRASSQIGAPPLGMALVPENGASVSARVERLLSGERPAEKNHRALAWAFLASTALAVSLNYAWVLVQMHEITEALLR